MLAALGRLQRLWYLILVCSIVCLISDITLSTTSDNNFGAFVYIPLPLIADVPTVLIFAYGLWGKSHPFLLPSSSPTSNPCLRWTRLSGTVLLCLLWMMNTLIYCSSHLLVRKILAGVAALISILILVEMVGSHRIAKEQRRILKKVEKGPTRKAIFEAIKVAKEERREITTTVPGRLWIRGSDRDNRQHKSRGTELASTRTTIRTTVMMTTTTRDGSRCGDCPTRSYRSLDNH